MELRKIYLVFGVVFGVLLFAFICKFLYNLSVPALPSSLPYITPSFVGRENETIDLTSLLQYTNDAPRIISITGGPGFGKTTLAVSMGYKLQEEGVDVVYVDINEASSKHVLAEKVVTSYKISVSARNVTLGDLYQWSKDLRHPTLLILDNCDEQFHTNKDDLQIVVKRLITQSNSKTLKVLTTSRRQVMYISSLKHHTFVIKELSTSNACKLLQGITKSLNATTCRDLANLTGSVPLALHVVGALLSTPIAPSPQHVISEMSENLIGTLSPEDLEAEDRVNVSIMLSYQYLETDEKKIGRYLSYFLGSFDKDAAYSIIKRCVLPNKNLVSRSLDLLVKRSLLDCDKRYVFHKLIREFFKNMSSLKESKKFEMCFLGHYASSLERITEIDFSKALGEFYTDKHNFKHFFDLLSAKCRDKNLSDKTAETVTKIAGIIDNFMNRNNILVITLFELRDFIADLLSFLKQIKLRSFNKDEFVRLYSSFTVNFMIVEHAFTEDTAILIESIEKHRWIFEKHGELVSPELYIKFYYTLATYYKEVGNHERAKECHKKVLQRKLNECHDSCSNLDLAKAFSFIKDYKSSTYYCNRELETIQILSSQNLIQLTKILIELFNIYLNNSDYHGIDQVTTKLIIVQSHLLKFDPAAIICELHTIIEVVDVLQSVNKKTESENILAHLKRLAPYSMQNCEMTVTELMATLMNAKKYDKVVLVGEIISITITDLHLSFRLLHFLGYSYYELGRYSESSSYYIGIVDLLENEKVESMNIAKSLAYMQLMRMGSLKYIHHLPSLLWYNTQFVYNVFLLYISKTPITNSTISYQYDDILASEMMTASSTAMRSSEDNSQYSISLSKRQEPYYINHYSVYFCLLVTILVPLILCCCLSCFLIISVCWCKKRRHWAVCMCLPPIFCSLLLLVYFMKTVEILSIMLANLT